MNMLVALKAYLYYVNVYKALFFYFYFFFRFSSQFPFFGPLASAPRMLMWPPLLSAPLIDSKRIRPAFSSCIAPPSIPPTTVNQNDEWRPVLLWLCESHNKPFIQARAPLIRVFHDSARLDPSWRKEVFDAGGRLHRPANRLCRDNASR